MSRPGKDQPAGLVPASRAFSSLLVIFYFYFCFSEIMHLPAAPKLCKPPSFHLLVGNLFAHKEACTRHAASFHLACVVLQGNQTLEPQPSSSILICTLYPEPNAGVCPSAYSGYLIQDAYNTGSLLTPTHCAWSLPRTGNTYLPVPHNCRQTRREIESPRTILPGQFGPTKFIRGGAS